MSTFDMWPYGTLAEPTPKVLTREKLDELLARFRRREPGHRHLELEFAGHRVTVTLSDVMPDGRAVLVCGKGVMADLEEALRSGVAKVEVEEGSVVSVVNLEPGT